MKEDSESSLWTKGILFAIFTSVIVIGLLFVVLLFFITPIALRNQNTTSTYQISEFDPLTNQSYLGIAKIPHILKSDEFLSFRNSKGNYISISKFGEKNKNYKCEGTCSCGMDSDFRRSVNVIHKSLFVVFSSISLILAINIAKDYFLLECTKFLSDEKCEENKIFASIDSCEEKENSNSMDVESENEGTQREGRRFKCRGICRKRDYFVNVDRNRNVDFHESVDCESFEVVKDMWITDLSVYERSDYWPEMNIPMNEWKLIQAEDDFRKNTLKGFCSKMGMRVYTHSVSYYDGSTGFNDVDIEVCTAMKYKEENKKNVWCGPSRLE